MPCMSVRVRPCQPTIWVVFSKGNMTHRVMGVRQSWRAERVCKTRAFVLNRFKSYHSHQLNWRASGQTRSRVGSSVNHRKLWFRGASPRLSAIGSNLSEKDMTISDKNQFNVGAWPTGKAVVSKTTECQFDSDRVCQSFMWPRRRMA